MPPEQFGLAYTRVSTDFETQANSVAVNDGIIRDYCAARRITVVGLFQEDITGKVPMEQRPEGRQVLAALAAGVPWQGQTVKPTHLIFGAVDRIGRRAAAMMNLVEGLLKQGIRVHIAEAGIGCIDLNEPAGWQMFQMLCVFAEGEQRRISKRIKDTLGYRRRAGYCTGTVPYGWTSEGTSQFRTKGDVTIELRKLVPHPEQQRVLRDCILPWHYRDGWGIVRIARALNEAGIPARRPAGELVTGHQGLPAVADGLWRKGHVESILGNLATRSLARELGYQPKP